MSENAHPGAQLPYILADCGKSFGVFVFFKELFFPVRLCHSFGLVIFSGGRHLSFFQISIHRLKFFSQSLVDSSQPGRSTFSMLTAPVSRSGFP